MSTPFKKVNLLSIRREHGITQEQLEKLTGVSQTMISQIERGVANPTLDILVKIVDALRKQGIDVDWNMLLSDEGKMKANSTTQQMPIGIAI